MTTRRGLAHDLVLPTILFAALGGMTWAVRGCSGYGAAAGCIFAGVTLGTAWWYIAREPGAAQPRRYASGWIILAMTVMFGIAGTRGWMQWPHFFNNVLYINYPDETVPISRAYGFAWLFIAGIPWAGLGACGIAWCVTDRPIKAWQWVLRIACGIGGAYLLSVVLFRQFPQVFLPLYDNLEDKYQDLENYKSLWKLHRDNREAMIQLGLYLGFLFFETARRDWKNVLLITTVGLLNGIGWALLQNWMWSARLWPGAQFNFWRAWETSGGISIGIAFGVAYYLANRPRKSPLPVASAAAPGTGWLAAFAVTALLTGLISVEVLPAWCSALLSAVAVVFGVGYFVNARRAGGIAAAWSPYGPNIERWGGYVGLILGLGLSLKNGCKGWANIYLGNEAYWNAVFTGVFGPIMVLLVVAVSVWVIARPLPAGRDAFPRAYGLLWLVLLVQYSLALLITGPLANWNEVVFILYYLLLFVITAVIVFHYRYLKSLQARA